MKERNKDSEMGRTYLRKKTHVAAGAAVKRSKGDEIRKLNALKILDW